MISSDESTTSSIAEYDTLVLSGSATKGFITLGAVQYAFDNNLLNNLQTYIGTSSGSMICYLLCIGYTPIEIMVYICTNQIMEKLREFNVIGMVQGRGAVSYNTIQESLEKMTISKIGYLPTLEDLKIKYNKTFICATHNLTKDCTEYLSYETHPTLPCITAIRMSSTIPLIFETYKYNNNSYVDGGISDNFPIDLGEKIGNKILGIMLLMDNTLKFQEGTDKGIIDFMQKIIFIPVCQYVKHKVAQINKEKVKVVCINKTDELYHTNDKIELLDFNINTTTKMDMFAVGYQKMKLEFD